MKITNEYNLPELLMLAVQNDTHQKTGDISVTELWSPPQMSHFKNDPRAFEDLSDRIWMLLGTATHAVIEQALGGNKRYKSEEHMRIELEVDGKTYSISGTMDIYDTELRKIQDFKVTSAWSYVFGSDKTAWIAQLNTYAWMARKLGMEVEAAEIIAIYRDWSKAKVYDNPDYPRHQAGTINIPLYSQESVEKRIIDQLRKHIAVWNGEKIPCTPEDKWQKATTYAVKQTGRKRALRVLPTKADAEKYLDENNVAKGFIEERKGERTRCEFYCSARSVCPQKAREDME